MERFPCHGIAPLPSPVLKRELAAKFQSVSIFQWKSCEHVSDRGENAGSAAMKRVEMESAAFNSDQTLFTANIPASDTDRDQSGSPGCPILIGIGEFLRREKHRETERPGADSRMSPPRPLAAFKLLCAAASRFISHSVPSVRESLCRVGKMTETAAAEAAPPAAPAAQTKAPKKKKAPARNKAAGPKLGEQIDQIVAGCADKKGMSGIAIKRALADRGVDVAKRRAQIKMSIKRKVETGSLLQTKGVGFSGSFKAGKEKSSVKLVKKAKKPAAKKPAAKKLVTKKPAAKKSVARKSGAKKSPTKTQGGKKPAAKKAAAQKPATKKAAPKKAKSPKKVAAPKAKVVKKLAKNKPKAAKPRKAAGKKK